MIIDIHGHYTTAPTQLRDWRLRQIESAGTPFTEPLTITDDEIRETVGTKQLKNQQDRGTDVALFSPTAGGMAHHYGDEQTSIQWTTTVTTSSTESTSCSLKTSSRCSSYPNRPAQALRTASRN